MLFDMVALLAEIWHNCPSSAACAGSGQTIGGLMSLSEKMRDYKAGKGTLLGACAACVVATMIVGFTWGGWTTAGASSAAG
jgi:hypothetical protein